MRHKVFDMVLRQSFNSPGGTLLIHVDFKKSNHLFKHVDNVICILKYLIVGPGFYINAKNLNNILKMLEMKTAKIVLNVLNVDNFKII